MLSFGRIFRDVRTYGKFNKGVYLFIRLAHVSLYNSMLQNDHAKTVSLFPRENGLTRLFVHFDENELAIRKEQFNRNKIQLEDIQREAKRALLPHRLEFLGILYWSVYVVGQRRASAMDAMDHRVFLCGDAAHSQSPTLGQGLNSGFGDVFNLVRHEST